MATGEYPTGTVAFLFTDIEGSTARWERHGAAMRAAVDRHFGMLGGAVDAAGGVLFKTVGDAVQAAFPSVPRALAAAVAAQRAIAADDWGDLAPFEVRMAVHAGEATPAGGDYLAPCLNRLSRILGAGHGGQVLLSDAARLLAGNDLPADVGLRDLGVHRLRDLLAAETIWQVAGAGLPDGFPPLLSLDAARHNLPAQPTPLIGREEDVARLRKLLAGGARIVTVTGAGGSGKTRLALQVAADEVDRWPDGTWFVPLAGIDEAANALDAIAAATGAQETAGDALLDTLVAHLSAKAMLLVIDNCEHLPEIAPVLARLSAEAPGMAILATSREPLRVRGEREWSIGPLPVPPDAAGMSPADLLAWPAVRLFAERAAAIRPDFALDAGNAADVVAICRRLDGLPLAIELAAARIRILPPAALLQRLEQRLRLLTGGPRDLPERQQTLRATIAWSYDLLDPEERPLFDALSVFAGGWSLEAAETVCAAMDPLEIDVLDGLDSLVQKHLVRREDGDDARFSMLQTVREFGLERLEAGGHAAALRHAHAMHYLAKAERLDESDSERASTETMDRFERDHDNLRQAILAFAAARAVPEQVRLAAALWFFWWVRGHFSEGRAALDAAVAASGQPGARDPAVAPRAMAAALTGAATLAEAVGDYPRATALHEEALAIRRRENDRANVAASLTALGVIAQSTGELERARRLHEEALALWREVGDPLGEAGALRDLGAVALFQARYADARSLLQRSLAAFERERDGAGAALALQALGLLAVYEDRPAEAIPLYERSLELWRELGNRQMIATDLGNLAESRFLAGDRDRAEALAQEALGRYAELADSGGRAFALALLAALDLRAGNARRAQDRAMESLDLRWTLGELAGVAESLEILAEALLALGQPAQAGRLLDAADALRTEIGVPAPAIYRDDLADLRAAVPARPQETAPPDPSSVIRDALRLLRGGIASGDLAGALQPS